jgi:hypothetical protein
MVSPQLLGYYIDGQPGQLLEPFPTRRRTNRAISGNVMQFFDAHWDPTNSNSNKSNNDDSFNMDQKTERQELDSYHADVVNVVHDRIAFQELKADIRSSRMCTGAGAQQVIQQYVGDRAKQIEQRYLQKPKRRRAIVSQSMNLATVQDSAGDEVTEPSTVKPSFFLGLKKSVSWSHLKDGSRGLDGVMQSLRICTKRSSAPSAA